MHRRHMLCGSLASALAAALPAGEPRRPPRILLRSSWQIVNIGDIAHTPGVLALIEKHLPEAEVILWASGDLSPEVAAMEHRRFPRLRIVKGTLGGSGAGNRELEEAVAWCDFLLHGSGPSLVGRRDVAAFEKATGKPFGIYGITYSGAAAEERELISRAEFAFFRDSVSLAKAREDGVSCPVMEFAPDGAFACDLRNDAAATAFLNDHGLEPGRFLCCIPRLRYTPYWKIRGRAMSDEDRRRHAHSEAMKEHDHAPLREAIAAVVRQTGLKVLVCPEDQSQMAVGREMLVDPLPADVHSHTVWRETFWLPDEAISTYVRSAGLFGLEMHSPIMCIGNGVPAIVCRFAEQTSKGFMWRDIGLGDWLFDVDQPEDRARIVPAVLSLVTDAPAARAKVAKAQAFVQRRQRETMGVLRRCLAAVGAMLLLAWALPAFGQLAAPASGEAPAAVSPAPAAEPQPLMIEAWRKDGPRTQYPTRILEHLDSFEPQQQVPRDRFGGWAVNRQPATGFFHARRLGERWWLIDPDGHPFLHVAVNSVRAGNSPQNRAALPERFGSLESWRDATANLLWEHGFNGTGCWSDDDTLRQAAPRLVYTPVLNFMSSYGRKRGGTFQEPGHTGYPNRCIFVFDREFEQFALQHAQQVAAHRDDPYLLGYFTDNELPLPDDLLDRYLQRPAEDLGRQAAAEWMKARGLSGTADIREQDREDWRAHVVDRYFEICARAIRQADPHHMILGSRFYGPEKRSQAVFQAAGRHLDAVSVNVYGVWTPTAEMLDRWSRWSGKPLLITEWYAKGADTGMPNLSGAGWTVPTQQDRGAFYQNFALALLESQVCVGWHWFKYMDNDPLDLSTDPSNRDSNKGIVTAGYEPHLPLLEAMRQLNGQVYPLAAHFDAAGGE